MFRHEPPHLSRPFRVFTARYCVLALIAATLSLVSGCGGGGRPPTPMGTVKGTVTIGGKPLAEGRVNLVGAKSGFGAGGDVKTDGTYNLEGAVPTGAYDVFITFNIPPAKIGTPAEDVMKSVPKKYLSQTTSGLKADVKEGENTHDVKLDAK